ncbi:MAG: hypothetical protein ACO1TE_01910 [Prosthecobacter sp.]
MKSIPMILFAVAVVFGLSSCDTYVDGGHAYRPGYRPGYVSTPGYVRPGYSRPYYSSNRNYYSSPSRSYHSSPSRSYYRPSSYRGRDNDRRDWDRRRDSDRSRYYRSSGARTNTRVNVGPVGVSNSNWLRF